MIRVDGRVKILCIFLLACAAGLFPLSAAGGQGPGAASQPAEAGQLEAAFRQPLDSAKPWAYWWWLNANVTKESITRDLEAMKAKGLGGFLLFDVTAYGHQHVPAPPRRVEFMSPQWRELVKWAMAEASRLGLEMSMNLSTCGGALRAPWPTGQNAPKSLVWASADVRGPRRVTAQIPRLEGPQSWDLAVLAVRVGGQAESAQPTAPSPSQEIRWSNDPKTWQPAVLKPGDQLASEVVDLTGRVGEQGRLVWDAPAGSWRLVRFLCTLQEDTESDVDMLDAKAVEEHFRRFGKAILEDAGPLAGKTLTHFYSVSWEGAIPTWTFGFDREFEKYRGYRLWPYLPVLAGMVVQSREVSERFLRDYSRTLSDCFLNNCYGKLSELCHREGLKWHSESGGPWRRDTALFSHADSLSFWGRNDMPQGEFWWPGKPAADRSNARMAANAAHIYGRPLASIEAFTHMRLHWSAYPAALKPAADAAFCDGVNRFIWHTFSASPPEFGKPGIVYFAGTHLNPNVTWFEQAGPFLAYLARCQTLLQRGQFVADVCLYASDRNYATWTRAAKWNEFASLPVPPGYRYDRLSTEVLLARLSVKDGRLCLPDGMQYRVLLVDLEEEEVPAEAVRKIVELARQGATVVLGQRRPQHAPGLADYPSADEHVRRLAAELWGDSSGPAERPLGQGKVICGVPLDQALLGEGIPPDLEGPWEFLHRRIGDADVYFVSGHGSSECTFRVCGKEPEFWDPKTGQIWGVVHYRQRDDGRTSVPVQLPESGSVFVVFRKPARQPHVVSVRDPAGGLEVAGRSDGAVRLRQWASGCWELQISDGRTMAVVRSLPEPLALDGSWEVRFAPGCGAPESVEFDSLIAWDTHPHPGIRHFSGTATYRKRFQLDAAQAKGLIRLQLGEVKHIARVRVNGKDAGIAWSSPWAVDLTGLAARGANELEIEVTNLWVNRLIGDAGLPPEQRLTRTNVLLEMGERQRRPYQSYSAKDPLVTSGLLGPVRLEFGERHEVRL